MGSFHLSKMSLKNITHKPATKMYPVVAPTYTKMSKGHITCNIETCTLCSVCEKRCPTHAISVDKPGGTWSIDPFACIQCRVCVNICPRNCLTMQPEYFKAAPAMSVSTMNKADVEPAAEVAATAEA